MISFQANKNAQSQISFDTMQKNTLNSNKSLSAASSPPSFPTFQQAQHLQTNRFEPPNPNKAMINNYEILEFDSSNTQSKNSNMLPSVSTGYDANTIDVYLYRDANFYEDGGTKELSTLPKPPDNLASTAFIEVKSANTYETAPRPASTNLNTSNTNNYNTYQAVKYLIDVNDLKQHLQSNTNYIKSDDLTINKNRTLPSANINTTHYEMSSQCNLVQPGTLPQVNNFNKKVNKNKIELHSGGCCCSSCCGLLSLFCNFLSVFSSCCFKPCCSTAAVLGGVGALGGLLAGVVFAGVFGIIPIPYDLTKSICNSTIGRHNIIYQENFTVYKTLEKNSTKDPFGFRLNKTLLHFSTTSQTTTNSEKKYSMLLKNKIKTKLKNQQKLKSKITKLIALQYDVLLLPSPDQNLITDLSSGFNNFGMDMKINLDVKLYCNYSTSLMYFSTREFSNIELNIQKTDEDLEIKKWNHDSTTNLLEIEINKNCTFGKEFKMNIFISYKNYGSYLYDKSLKNVQSYYLTTFNSKLDYPFPIMVENFNQQTPIFAGPSVFNITLAKLKSAQTMIFNMDILKKNEQDGLDFIYYKPTPFLPAQTIGLIFGNINCKEYTNQDKKPFVIRVCSINSKNNADMYDGIAGYVKSLIQFYGNYTKKPYILEKLDVVILPTSTIIDLVNNDFSMIHMGIVYLSSSFVVNTYDQLTKTQNKLKIINMLSKQLIKHWFYNFFELHCDKNNHLDDNNYDITTDTVNIIRNFCQNNACMDHNYFLDKSTNDYLELNEKCYLYKGFIGWISYLGFQSLLPEYFDLVHLEWSLIKDLDNTFFLPNQNLNHIYQQYDFPRLAESDNIQKIKTDLKSMLSVRSIYLMFGSDRFQSIVNDWFKIVQVSELNSQKSSNNTQVDLYFSALNAKMSNPSILNVLEQYIIQYNIITLDNVSIRNVLRSWIVSNDDVVITLNRNYNKKEASVNVDTPKSVMNMVNYYFPLYWLNGNVKLENSDKSDLNNELAYNQINNLMWINETGLSIKNLPGAERWIIGNQMGIFSLFRTNYDKNNWRLILGQLLYNHKSFTLNERVQLIDDAFYLVNQEKLPISVALDLFDYLPAEENFLPWKYAVYNIRKIIRNIEDDSPTYSEFRKYLINLIKPIYHRLKWGESLMDTTDEKLIRILVVDLLCSIDYEDCVENSVKQLTDSIKINVYNIPQYLSKSIYCTAIRYTGINEWFYLWNHYQKQMDNTNIKDYFLYSLSCSSQIWVLNLFLRKLVYENSVPTSQLPVVLDYIVKNPVGKYIVWNHISQNYQTFFNKIGNEPELFFKILQVSTKEFKFKYEIKQVYDFIEEIGLKNFTISQNTSPTSEKYSNNINIMDSIFSNIQTRVNSFTKWKQANEKDLNDWLSQKRMKKSEL